MNKILDFFNFIFELMRFNVDTVEQVYNIIK